MKTTITDLSKKTLSEDTNLNRKYPDVTGAGTYGFLCDKSNTIKEWLFKE